MASAQGPRGLRLRAIGIGKLPLVALFALATAGCDDDGPRTRPSAFDGGPPPGFATARRPSHTVYLERDDARCAVYWQQNGARSVKKTVDCPRDLEAGERLRLTGMTCHRESAEARREVPVRCASPLFEVREALASGEGAFHLPADPRATASEPAN